MNSFIGWVGGKKQLRKEIIARFPSEFKRYIEVFGGAGWVLFAKEKSNLEVEIFNDIDSELINLYRCIKYHCEALQEELNWLTISREQFLDSKNQMSITGLTDIQRAARYFHLIKTSFCSERKSFGIGKQNFISALEYLPKIKERLKNTIIENKDFESLIKSHDRDNALFYLDPPYNKTEKYYSNNFSVEDHVRLNEILKSIKGKFILSYNDDGFIRELYKDFNIEEISRNNNFNRKPFKELIIRNYI